MYQMECKWKEDFSTDIWQLLLIHIYVGLIWV